MDYVMIPGAWHAKWAWQPVANRLRQSGHRALCITLPGLDDADERSATLDDAVRHVVSEVRRRDLHVVTVVAHSLGGFLAPLVAAELHDRVRRVAFVDAFVPTPGESMNDANPSPAQEYVRSLIDASDDHSVAVPDLQLFHSALMQDVSQEAARIVHELLQPTPGAYFLTPYSGPPVVDLDVELSYVLAEHDQGLARPGRELAAQIGCDPVAVEGSHEALLSNPSEIAACLAAE